MNPAPRIGKCGAKKNLPDERSSIKNLDSWSDSSVPLNRGRIWHLSHAGGCQGFTGPNPSTFLDKREYERTGSKCRSSFYNVKILF